MKTWLKNLYWTLYYEYEIQWRWLPKPELKTYHVLFVERGNE